MSQVCCVQSYTQVGRAPTPPNTHKKNRFVRWPRNSPDHNYTSNLGAITEQNVENVILKLSKKLKYSRVISDVFKELKDEILKNT